MLRTGSISIYACIFALATLAINGTTVTAATTAKDAKIIGKAVGFLEPGISGATTVAIVYDSGDAASTSDAEGVQSAFAGVKAGKNSIETKLVDVNALSDLSGTSVAVLAAGTESHQAAVQAAAAAAGILTASTDMSCVQAGHCVLGVATSPKVEILVSKAAREAAGLSFKTAFLMMVKEL